MPDTTYEIRISGLVSQDLLQDCGDVSVTRTSASTLLSGSLSDQAALLGLLERLRAHGLDVVEVHQVVQAPDSAAAASSAVDDATCPRRDDSAGAHHTASGRNARGTAMTEDFEEAGPVDYLVMEFPGNKFTGEAFPLLVELVDRGIIRILDLAFVVKDDEGTVVGVELADLDGDGSLDLAVFQGASSGLLGQDDLAEAGNALKPGSSAGILVSQNAWAGPFAAALRRSGGRLVASGRIPIQAMLAKLDALESVG